MNILITGAAGFIGNRLARKILESGNLAGRRVERLVLLDQFAPADDLRRDARVECRTGPLLDQCAALRDETYDGIFHLASAVSGECELDFELGLRSNLDSTRALLEAVRASTARGHPPTRFVFASSSAVFGADEGHEMPQVVTDETLPAPQTSYGTHKLMCEYLLADYTRKGFIDGRSARLVTVTVRPGKPNGAASSFFSSIIREPLAGRPAVCPVSPDVAHPVSSPGKTVEGLIRVFECGREQLGGRLALNFPALNVRVGEMLEALEKVAGRPVRSLVRFEHDERIAKIVAGWPMALTAERAKRIGLEPATSFEAIVREYVAEFHPELAK
ncbi:MAG TPA: D-erythronate dehydrogenase [Ramlibacter sp.]|uniref:D-erythronate dehydrogenase n=1 Tax=Ramlibacter sp. TaxID=1917967 RepID=UPI002BE196AA|nr:D-erythronate dehydrogenase [Ramlibacter sp.]HVZ44924.1 D-erythronate dehydrogenase [Ramlibacter sp.]